MRSIALGLLFVVILGGLMVYGGPSERASMEAACDSVANIELYQVKPDQVLVSIIPPVERVRVIDMQKEVCHYTRPARLWVMAVALWLMIVPITLYRYEKIIGNDIMPGELVVAFFGIIVPAIIVSCVIFDVITWKIGIWATAIIAIVTMAINGWINMRRYLGGRRVIIGFLVTILLLSGVLILYQLPAHDVGVTIFIAEFYWVVIVGLYMSINFFKRVLRRAQK